MDFGQLLHTAQRNEKSKDQKVKYYSTKFEPPKKEKKSSQLSENIKKFLAKKEAEERKKAEEDRKRREELLALRSQDKKATKRVNVMLKRTKSANQSVIQDAIDNDNTAVTLAGPMQPDEDDYGYVSQEATQFYNQMMEKYNKMPNEPKFDMSKKKVSTNLGNTKDRVRAALEKEKEDALLPHKRKRKHKEDDEEGVSYGAPERNYDDKYKDEKSVSSQKKSKKVPAPPPMNFADLLKIAEKKQFEPIKIEKKEKEEERLLTKKQKREMEKERESQIRREERRKEISKMSKTSAEKNKLKTPQIPKISENSKSINSNVKIDNDKLKSSKEKSTTNNNNNNRSISKNLKNIKEDSPEEEYIPGKYLPGDLRYRPELENKKPSNDANIKKSTDNKPSQVDDLSNKKQLPINLYNKKTPSSDVRGHLQVNNKSNIKPAPSTTPQKKYADEPQSKKFPPDSVKRKLPAKLPPKQFPPPDMKRRDERMGPPRFKKPMNVKKGRILDDDDSEYDSEMDDFIDDGDDTEDYSRYISEIFGYDKSRYRDIEDDGVDNMESSFAQQMKEEIISTKIGILEDLEEEKKEEEAKRRKMLMKKKMKS
ncbi:unnamed protein product [Phyllotreta striolata]|uniref:Protein SPT2 homolog n=1 Tax=Phyllotreta striolata TaxID=444603 RepID=A0A9N9XK22_PHYSR|nr:unnamed protein product [Phyllotreta striolata]